MVSIYFYYYQSQITILDAFLVRDTLEQLDFKFKQNVSLNIKQQKIASGLGDPSHDPPLERICKI